MHTLVLIRHAKSSWRHDEAPDLLRPVAGRGYRELAVLANDGQLSQFLPDKVLCSPAVRTYTTALALMSALAIDDRRLQLMAELYEASGDNLWQLLKRRVMPSQQKSCWLVGHSPGLDQLIALLTGDEERKVATGQVVVLQSKQWLPGSYEIVASVKPKAKK